MEYYKSMTRVPGGTAVIGGREVQAMETCFFDGGDQGITKVCIVAAEPVSEAQRRANRAAVDEALEKMYLSVMETRRKRAEGTLCAAASQ